jgi:hypothetical protein
MPVESPRWFGTDGAMPSIGDTAQRKCMQIKEIRGARLVRYRGVSRSNPGRAKAVGGEP